MPAGTHRLAPAEVWRVAEGGQRGGAEGEARGGAETGTAPEASAASAGGAATGGDSECAGAAGGEGGEILERRRLADGVTRVTATETALGGTARNPNLGTLNFSLDDPPTRPQVQAILDEFNTLLNQITRV